jgi:hypothetical protein
VRAPSLAAVGIAMLLVPACFSKAQTPAGLPEAVAREVKDGASLPKGTYTLARGWEAETASHLTGRVVDDPEAQGGKALEASPGVDEPNTLLFGRPDGGQVRPGSARLRL